jgi:hypothetical protein
LETSATYSRYAHALQCIFLNANPTSITNAVRVSMSMLNQNTTTGENGKECQRWRLNSNTPTAIPRDMKGPYQITQSSSETTLQYPGCGLLQICMSQSANCRCVHQNTRSAKHARATTRAATVSALTNRNRDWVRPIIGTETSGCGNDCQWQACNFPLGEYSIWREQDRAVVSAL